MKKFLLGLAVLVVVVFATPFILYGVRLAASSTSFYISLANTNTDACTQYYTATDKGTIWSHGEWHHYVDFKVDDSSTQKYWKLVDAPVPSTMWRIPPSSPDIVRASYRWPSNWQDPFPLSSWKVCAIGS